MKTKSAVTGKYATAKAAKAKPETHYVSDDYPARQLRKLVRLIESGDLYEHHSLTTKATIKLIANIKRRMGWK